MHSWTIVLLVFLALLVIGIVLIWFFWIRDPTSTSPQEIKSESNPKIIPAQPFVAQSPPLGNHESRVPMKQWSAQPHRWIRPLPKGFVFGTRVFFTNKGIRTYPVNRFGEPLSRSLLSAPRQQPVE